MTLLYPFALIVILSSTPGAHSLVIHQARDWDHCIDMQMAMVRKGVEDDRNITADCRRDVRVSFGRMGRKD